MAYEDCLALCFLGLLVGRNYVWCLVIVVIFMGLAQAGAKRFGGCLKVINWGLRCNSQRDTLFIGKAGSQYVILSFEILLQVLLRRFCIFCIDYITVVLCV